MSLAFEIGRRAALQKLGFLAFETRHRAALQKLGFLAFETRHRAALQKLGFLVTPWAAPLIQSAMPTPELTSSAPEDLALRERLQSVSPVPVRAGEGPAYAFGEPGHIQIPESMQKTVAPEVLAHEMGHAKIQPTLLGKLTQNRLRNPMYMLAPGVGLAAGAVDDDTLSTPAASAIAVAPTLPTLVSEGAASWKAMKYLREHGATPAQLSKGRGNLLKAFGTYAALPLTAAAEPWAYRALRDASKSEKSEHAPT